MFPNWEGKITTTENVLVLYGGKRPLPATAKEAQIAEDLKAKAKLILTIDASLYAYQTSNNNVHIRLENCESMTSYVSQIIETAHKLNGTGFEINDQWIGSLMLAGLPEKFSPMIMAIEHSGINISADAIKPNYWT
ncbi:hypothetical protein EVAR_17522_1 [Eumeta japonica]|uniref:Uncharacterized protein n=1 Tax=Eumeta variegata TaxID=151549 RepID=A0A4C1WTJ1_EUMVA|nr:hypothetical protein EVAR_17522_1 [Eumeta japonica]